LVANAARLPVARWSRLGSAGDKRHISRPEDGGRPGRMR
jgi:hypothetical protein